MIKRETKRKIRKTVSVIFLGIAFLSVVILIFLLWKFASPINIGLPFQNNTIVRPDVEGSSLSDLSKKLYDKNIIMDSLSAASESGVIVGIVRGGPTVYFSQNRSASWQVDSLALIIRSTTVGSKKPQLVDLRTTRPIVKF